MATSSSGAPRQGEKHSFLHCTLACSHEPFHHAARTEQCILFSKLEFLPLLGMSAQALALHSKVHSLLVPFAAASMPAASRAKQKVLRNLPLQTPTEHRL